MATLAALLSPSPLVIGKPAVRVLNCDEPAFSALMHSVMFCTKSSAWLKLNALAAQVMTLYLAAFSRPASACKSLVLTPAISVATMFLP